MGLDGAPGQAGRHGEKGAKGEAGEGSPFQVLDRAELSARGFRLPEPGDKVRVVRAYHVFTV